MFNRLSNAPNRSILYDLYNYICDIKSGVGLARAYVKTLGEEIKNLLMMMIKLLRLVCKGWRKAAVGTVWSKGKRFKSSLPRPPVA